jgi:hypothetical protein
MHRLNPGIVFVAAIAVGAFCAASLLLLVDWQRGRGPVGLDPPRNIRSVTIGYSVGFRDRPPALNRKLEVSDSKDVQAIVDAFRVKESCYGAVGSMPAGMLDFQLADGTSVTYGFVRADQLARGSIPASEPANFFLRDTALYDLVNKLLSKKERRPIDVLKVNDPEKGDDAQPEDELKAATSVTVYYRFQGAPAPNDAWPRRDLHSVTIADPKQVKEFVHLLVLDSRRKLTLPSFPNGLVRFQVPGQPVVECNFETPRQVSLWHPDAAQPGGTWVLNLKDDRFYDKCVELARNHEKGPVNLLPK